jgi:outer membrane protein assembly factor BamB
VLGERAYVGSGDGKLYEVTRSGKVTRTFDAGAPIFSSPGATETAIIVATTAGTVHAVSPETLTELWRCEAPEYAIEDTLFVGGDAIYFGAWDTYVYALDAQTGAVLWRSPAAGTLEGGAKQYYSPADCGPVVCGDRLYAADRKYYLSVMDAKTGALLSSRQEVSGVGLSEDGQSVYLRTTKTGLVKLDAEGNEVWTADVPLGYIAAAPVERDGIVYSLSTLGTLSAVEAATGKVLWTIKTLPGFYAMADPAIEGGVAYVAGMDGSVTAVAPR